MISSDIDHMVISDDLTTIIRKTKANIDHETTLNMLRRNGQEEKKKHTSKNELISKTYKEFIQLDNKQKIGQMIKNRHFAKKKKKTQKRSLWCI